MGFLSKLLGEDGKKVENSAKDFLKSVSNIVGDAGNSSPASAPSSAHSDTTAAKEPEQERPAEGQRSDALWGEIMPKDENQYTFNGTYREYFEDIFRSEFADFTFELTHPDRYDSDIYTFSRNGEKLLVVELVRKSCEAKKLRRDTENAGIGYLRFYIDCRDIGWWNARSYVVGRMRGILR